TSRVGTCYRGQFVDRSWVVPPAVERTTTMPRGARGDTGRDGMGAVRLRDPGGRGNEVLRSKRTPRPRGRGVVVAVGQGRAGPGQSPSMDRKNAAASQVSASAIVSMSGLGGAGIGTVAARSGRSGIVNRSKPGSVGESPKSIITSDWSPSI